MNARKKMYFENMKLLQVIVDASNLKKKIQIRWSEQIWMKFIVHLHTTNKIIFWGHRTKKMHVSNYRWIKVEASYCRKNSENDDKNLQKHIRKLSILFEKDDKEIVFSKYSHELFFFFVNIIQIFMKLFTEKYYSEKV